MKNKEKKNDKKIKKTENEVVNISTGEDFSRELSEKAIRLDCYKRIKRRFNQDIIIAGLFIIFVVAYLLADFVFVSPGWLVLTLKIIWIIIGTGVIAFNIFLAIYIKRQLKQMEEEIKKSRGE